MAASSGNLKFNIDFKVNKSELTSALRELQTSAEEVQKRWEKSGGRNPGFNAVHAKLVQAGDAAKRLQDIINGSWNDKLNQLNLNKFNTSVKESFGSLENLRQSLLKNSSEGPAAFDKISAAVLNTNTQIKQSSNLLDKMANTLANSFRYNISSAVFNKVTGSIQQAYYYTKDLQRELTSIRVVTGDSVEQMNRFASLANDAAKNLGRSTLDYTKAALGYYQQGLSEEQVQARTEVTLKAENITGAGSQMVDYLTSVWNGFQIDTSSIEDAQQAVDKMALVADSSASNMSELALAMSKVAATANTMGVSMDSLIAQLATVIATTRQAPEAVGTAFKSIYTRLNDIKTGAEDAQISLGNYSSQMASLGFNVIDANGELRDTGDVIEEIGSRWDSLSKAQQVYLARTMGGQRQITQVIALFDNWTRYSELLNKSLSAQGTLDEKNAIYLESLQAHLQNLETQIQKTLQTLKDTKVFNLFIDGFRGAIGIFNDFIKGLGSGTTILLTFGTVLSNIFSKQLADGLKNAKVSYDSFMDKIKGSKGKQDMANTDVDAAANEGAADPINNPEGAKTQIQARELSEIYKLKKLLTNQEIIQAQQAAKKIATYEVQLAQLQHEKEQHEQISEEEKELLDSMGMEKNILNSTQETQQAAVLRLKEKRELISRSCSDMARLQNAQHDLNELTKKEQQDRESVLNILQQNKKVLDEAFKKSGSNDSVSSLIRQITQGGSSISDIVSRINAALGNSKSKLQDQQNQLETIDSILQKIGFDNQEDRKTIIAKLQAERETTSEVQKQAAQRRKMQIIIKSISTAGQVMTSLVSLTQTFSNELSTAEDKANALSSTLSTSLFSIGSLISTTATGPFGMIAGTLISSLGPILATSLKKVFENGLTPALQKAEKQIKDFEDKISQSQKNVLKQTKEINTLESLAGEWETLSKKAGQYGSTIDNLTDQEKTRYYELIDTFAQYNDSVIIGYDKQGQAIVKTNKALQETIKILKQTRAEEFLKDFGNIDDYYSAQNTKKESYENAQIELTAKNSKDVFPEGWENLGTRFMLPYIKGGNLTDKNVVQTLFRSAFAFTDQDIEQVIADLESNLENIQIDENSSIEDIARWITTITSYLNQFDLNDNGAIVDLKNFFDFYDYQAKIILQGLDTIDVSTASIIAKYEDSSTKNRYLDLSVDSMNIIDPLLDAFIRDFQEKNPKEDSQVVVEKARQYLNSLLDTINTGFDIDNIMSQYENQKRLNPDLAIEDFINETILPSLKDFDFENEEQRHNIQELLKTMFHYSTLTLQITSDHVKVDMDKTISNIESQVMSEFKDPFSNIAELYGIGTKTQFQQNPMDRVFHFNNNAYEGFTTLLREAAGFTEEDFLNFEDIFRNVDFEELSGKIGTQLTQALVAGFIDAKSKYEKKVKEDPISLLPVSSLIEGSNVADTLNSSADLKDKEQEFLDSLIASDEELQKMLEDHTIRDDQFINLLKEKTSGSIDDYITLWKDKAAELANLGKDETISENIQKFFNLSNKKDGFFNQKLIEQAAGEDVLGRIQEALENNDIESLQKILTGEGIQWGEAQNVVDSILQAIQKGEEAQKTGKEYAEKAAQASSYKRQQEQKAAEAHKKILDEETKNALKEAGNLYSKLLSGEADSSDFSLLSTLEKAYPELQEASEKQGGRTGKAYLAALLKIIQEAPNEINKIISETTASYEKELSEAEQKSTDIANKNLEYGTVEDVENFARNYLNSSGKSQQMAFQRLKSIFGNNADAVNEYLLSLQEVDAAEEKLNNYRKQQEKTNVGILKQQKEMYSLSLAASGVKTVSENLKNRKALSEEEDIFLDKLEEEDEILKRIAETQGRYSQEYTDALKKRGDKAAEIYREELKQRQNLLNTEISGNKDVLNTKISEDDVLKNLGITSYEQLAEALKKGSIEGASQDVIDWYKKVVQAEQELNAAKLEEDNLDKQLIANQKALAEEAKNRAKEEHETAKKILSGGQSAQDKLLRGEQLDDADYAAIAQLQLLDEQLAAQGKRNRYSEEYNKLLSQTLEKQRQITEQERNQRKAVLQARQKELLRPQYSEEDKAKDDWILSHQSDYSQKEVMEAEQRLKKEVSPPLTYEDLDEEGQKQYLDIAAQIAQLETQGTAQLKQQRKITRQLAVDNSSLIEHLSKREDLSQEQLDYLSLLEDEDDALKKLAAQGKRGSEEYIKLLLKRGNVATEIYKKQLKEQQDLAKRDAERFEQYAKNIKESHSDIFDGDKTKEGLAGQQAAMASEYNKWMQQAAEARNEQYDAAYKIAQLDKELEETAKARAQQEREIAKSRAQQNMAAGGNAKSALQKMRTSKQGQQNFTDDESASLLFYQSQSAELQALADAGLRGSEKYQEVLGNILLKRQALVQEARDELLVINQQELAEVRKNKAQAESKITGQYSEEDYNKAKNTLQHFGYDQRNQRSVQAQEIVDQYQAEASLRVEINGYEQEENRLLAEKISLQSQDLDYLGTAAQKAIQFNDLMNKVISSGVEMGSADQAQIVDLMDDLILQYPQITKQAEILKQTWMSSTQEYRDALQEVTQVMNDMALNSIVEEIDQKFSDLAVEISMTANTGQVDEWIEEFEEYLNADKQLLIQVKTQADEEFQYVADQMDRIYNAAGKIGEGFVVAAKDLDQLSQVFPGILQNMELLSNGSYKLNQQVVQDALGAADATVQADIEAAKARLQNDADVAHQKAASFRTMASMAGKLADGQIDSAEGSATVQTSLSKELAHNKALNSKLTTKQETDNSKVVTDVNQSNASIMAADTVEAYRAMAQADAEYAEQAIANAQAVVAAMPKIAGPDASNPLFPPIGGGGGTVTRANIQNTYTAPKGPGKSGQGLIVSEDDIEGMLADAANLTGDEQKAAYKKIQEVSQASAEMWDAVEAELLRQKDLLGAQYSGLKQALDNVKQGLGMPGSGNKGGSSPKGSSGSNPKEQKQKQPDKMEKLDEQFDRYHDINIEIGQIGDQLQKIQEEQDKLFGGDLIDNLNQQLDLLDKQVAAYKEKIKLAKEQRGQLQKSLEKQGVTFDNDGNISNYQTILKAKQDEVNAMIQRYNGMSAEQQKTYKETVQQAKKDFQEFQKQLGNYDTLNNETIPELEKNVRDSLNKQIEINISKFKMAIQIQLDLSQAERDWNEFRKKVIDKTRDDDILGNAESEMRDFRTYYGPDGTGEVPELTDQVNFTLAELKKMDKGGTSDVYGNDRAQALEDLKHYNDQLQSSMMAAEEKVKNIKKAVLSSIDAAAAAIQKQKDDFEFISSLIEHDTHLIELVYGEKSYDALLTQYDKQQDLLNQQIEFSHRQEQMWQRKINQTQAEMEGLNPESNEWKELNDQLQKYKENWKKSTKQVYENIEKAIENAQKKRQVAFQKTMQQARTQLYGGVAPESAKQEWEYYKDESGLYLDEVNRLYQVNSLQAAYKKLVKQNEGNLGIQKKIKDAMTDQIGVLREKDKLSQYEIDRAKASLEILEKQIALDEIRNNKNTLRLRRDSQGNYSYQYTANEEETGDAEQELRDARNRLYNLDLNAMKENRDKLIQLEQAMSEEIAAIWEDTSLTNEQRQQKMAQVRNHYQTMMTETATQGEEIRKKLYDTTFGELTEGYTKQGIKRDEAIKKAKQALNAKNDTSLPASFRGAVDYMSKTLSGDGEGSFKSVYDKVFNTELPAIHAQYEEEIKDVQEKSGKSFGQIVEGINPAITKTKEWVDSNDDVIEKQNATIQKVKELRAQIEGLTSDYLANRAAGINAATAASDYWSQAQKDAAARAKIERGKQIKVTGGSSGDTKDDGSWTEKAVNPENIPKVTKSNKQDIKDETEGNIDQDRRNRLLNYKFSGETPNRIYYADGQEVGRSKGMDDYTSQDARIIQELINWGVWGKNYSPGWWKPLGYKSADQIFKKYGFATGGYTGNWEGQNGKFAMLHQKQLVLNASDTENILAAVNVARTISDMLQSISGDTGFGGLLSRLGNSQNTPPQVDQNVRIEAHFPNVTNSDEIERAFDNLVNQAAQYAFRF